MNKIIYNTKLNLKSTKKIKFKYNKKNNSNSCEHTRVLTHEHTFT